MAALQADDDRGARGLKFQQLADDLRRDILAGTWPVGSKLPTEDELARRSGLSLTTVRRAFDELVRSGLVVRRQGAGSFVAATAHHRTAGRTVGVLIPATTAYYPKVLQGIEDTLAVARADLRLATYDYEPEREDDAIAGLLADGAEGLVLAPTLLPPVDGPARVEELRRLAVPIVLLERSLDGLGPGDRTEHVCSDHAGGGYDAVRYLWDAGHRRIGLLVRTASPTGLEVEAGYLRAVDDLGARPVVLRAPLEEWLATGAHPMLDLLRAERCTAVLAFGDREALVLQDSARSRGVRIPQDLALVSYDDELAEGAPVPMTAVSPAKHRLGVLATQVLLRRLAEGDACPLHQIRLRPRLVRRSSCGVGPAGTPPVAVSPEQTAGLSAGA